MVTRFRGPLRAKHVIESLELIPSGGGVFDVEADGVLIFSKHKVGRHAKVEEVVMSVEKILKAG